MGDGQTVQHTERFAAGVGCIGPGRVVVCPVDRQRDDGVHRRIHRVDAGHMGVEHLARRHLPSSQHRGQVDSAALPQVVAHRPSIVP